jgi:hypothetical protein
MTPSFFYCGELGEPEDVHSGWAVRTKPSDRCDDQAWDEAYQNCEEHENHDDSNTNNNAIPD